MKVHLSGPPTPLLNGNIRITGSKSESNRILLLQALYPNIKIENLSNSDDAQAMQSGLVVKEGTVDIHHAGTAMRFLTAFFATCEGRSVILTGSPRMQERPVKILVEALKHLGADIEYLGNEGFPPLRINGRRLEKHSVSLPANVSSQYISALLLVAPRLENGLELELLGQVTSIPYIKMTLALLSQLGIDHSFIGNNVQVWPKPSVSDTTLIVESDWSSASYFYSIAALAAKGTELVLRSYKKDSLQGDSVLSDLYREFGVSTLFRDQSVVLKKTADLRPDIIQFDLANAPDLAQTIAVTCFGMGMGCQLTGLHTLKIKETDRLEALKTELSKLGAAISVTDASLTLLARDTILSNQSIATYNDHRMAMAFAPLALCTSLSINDAEVVSKSYPGFWEDLRLLQFQIKED